MYIKAVLLSLQPVTAVSVKSTTKKKRLQSAKKKKVGANEPLVPIATVTLVDVTTDSQTTEVDKNGTVLYYICNALLFMCPNAGNLCVASKVECSHPVICLQLLTWICSQCYISCVSVVLLLPL